MTSFDPAEHTAAEVNAYLAGTTDPAEYDRVVAAEQEREGGARVTALNGVERPLEADSGTVLPQGAEPVSSPPSGRWERLLGADGQPIVVDGAQVRLR